MKACNQISPSVNYIPIVPTLPFLFQTFVATGTNLCLQFCPHALNDDKPKDMSLPSENVSFDLENHKVNMSSRFIMNGVCIKWVGWIDLDTLVGKARLIFDEEQARVGYTVVQCLIPTTPHRC